MSTLHNLCEKWSGKGLYECQRRQVGSEVTFVVTVGKDRTLVDPYGKHAGAYILAAVIEAIEARGWDYRLAWRMAPTGEHFGVVRVTREDGWEKSWSCYAKSPAAALLTAYLAAQEQRLRAAENALAGVVRDLLAGGESEK